MFLTIATIILFAIPAMAITCPVGQLDFSGVCGKPNPMQGIADLRLGNQSYVTGDVSRLTASSTQTVRDYLAGGQHPYAIVLTCSDSRVPPEILFNRGLGEIFTVRVAGNIVADHELGSIEYAIEHLGANLIVVLGHERCGAVTAAYDDNGAHVDMGPNLNSLVAGIKPAIDDVLTAAGGKAAVAGKAAQVEECILQNMKKVTESLEVDSTIIKEAVEQGHLKIVQAKYDLDDGLVSFDVAPLPVFYSEPQANSTSGNFNIGWQTVGFSGATYVVEVSKDGGAYTPVYSGPNTYVNVTGLTDGSYIYRVKTTKAGNMDSAWKLTAASTVALVAPTPAFYLIPAATSSTGNVSFGWQIFGITGATYNLEANKDGAGFAQVYSGTNSYANLTGLAAGSYVFRVQATKAGYTPSPWVLTGATTVSLVAPAPAFYLVPPANSTTGNVSFGWQTSGITGATFVIEQSTDGGTTYTQAYSGLNSNANLTGLAAGSYTFRIRTTKAGYTPSAWISAGTTTTVALVAPAPALYLVPPTNSTTGNISFGWQTSGITGATFVIEQSTDGGTTYTQAYSGLNSYANLNGLAAGSYIFRIRTTKAGYTPSAWVSAGTTTFALIAAAPALYLAPPANNTTGNVSFGWQTFGITGATFVIERSTDGGTTYTQAYSGLNSYANLTGLAAGSYIFRIRTTKAGYTPSAWISAGTTTVALVAAAPAFYLMPPANSTTGNVSFGWQTSGITGATFVLEQSTDGGTTYTQAYSGLNSYANLTGLANGSYVFRIRTTKAGYAPSAWISTGTTTVSLVAPNPSFYLVPQPSSKGNVSFGWQTSGITGATFVIEASTDAGITYTQVYSGLNSYANLTGLTAGSYVFRIRTTKTGYNPSAWISAGVTTTVTP
jgi:carbonic anhydrase